MSSRPGFAHVSDRVALMWAVPFSIGLALFAGELVTFVLGERWRMAEDLLVVLGLSVGLGHIAFNWIMFFRALDDTRPILVATATHTVISLVVLMPATPTLARALSELALFVVATVVGTLLIERRLITELAGYVLSGSRRSAVAA